MPETNLTTIEECIQSWKDFEIPGPRPHPCVFFNQDEIDEILRLSRIEGTRQYKEQQKIIEVANVLLTRKLSISRRGWQGGSRWACLNCGTREVEMRRDQPDRGRCLRCGTINDDTEFKSWWAVEMHGRSMHQLRILTWAYLFTSKTEYAEKALEIMLDYAEWLPDCPTIDPGRLRFSVDPQLDMRFGIQMAYSYDLLYNYTGWSNEKRAIFEENVLRSTVKLNVERWPEFRLHNMYNTGCVLMAAVGLCLGEPEYVERGVNEEYGLIRSLAEGVNEDGFWPESSLNYHLAVVRDIVSLTEAVYHAGFNFYQVDKYRNMFLGPLKLAEPTTGVIPGWGDSGNFSPDVFDVVQAAYEVFYHRTRNLIVGAYLKDSSKRGRLSFGSLFITESWLNHASDFRQASTLLDVEGLVALRSGSGERSKYIQLNYLRKIGGHNQEDRLNLIAHALDGFIGPKVVQSDYSYPTYSWSREAIGHNMVVIGGKSQDPWAGGELAFYATFEQIQAVSAQANKSYPGYKQQRTVILVGDHYIIDLFHIDGDTPTTMDWVWHCQGELVRPDDALPAAPQGEGAYRFVEDAVRIHTDDSWQAKWTFGKPDLGVREYSSINPYEDAIDWAASTDDFIVRIKPDSRRAKVYNNITGYTLYPTPIMSPVFSSVYNYGSEFPLGDEKSTTPPTPQRAPCPYGYFTLIMAGQPGTEVYFAMGPGYGWQLPARMPFVLVRRHGSWTNFMTALDTYREEPYVLSVQSLVNKQQAAAMQVTTRDSQETFIANYGNSPVDANGVYLEGQFAAVSVQAGKVNWAVLVNARCLRLDDFVVEAEQPGTFVVEPNLSGQWQARTETGEAVVHCEICCD